MPARIDVDFDCCAGDGSGAKYERGRRVVGEARGMISGPLSSG